MAQVFISYSRVDAAFVELFIRRLQRAFPDLKIWHDQAPHGLIGGGNWWNDILAAIAASDVFIYILSNESVSSLYCQAEFTEARRLQKRIITVQARDKTTLTDDLDDIQFINMKDGVDSPDAFASLVAAVNLRLREAQKYQNARPLWKPPTPKPNKEAPPTRTADASDITTPALEKPTAEVEALRFAKESERRQTRITLIGIGVTILVTFFAALIGLIPWLTERSENANATQAALALTPSASPTSSITPTPEDTATPTETLDVVLIVASLDAQATIDQATLNAQATAAARLTEVAVGTQSVIDQTATATLWTLTPTPNITASIEAFRTEQAQTATQAWIDSWTATPTPDPLQAALAAARAFSGGNADWVPVTHAFADGVPMVLVPAGCFDMGSDNGGDDEQPINEQCFDAPFWIDLTEVTQADFERLGGRKANANRFDGDQRPVEQITWFEARDFCARRGARLPTEAEWEYAARGPAEWDYPWGAAWNASNAVWDRSSSQGTANVGSIPAGRSWVGAFDLSGNVWEWTSSLYLPYDSTEDREADTGTRTDVPRVLRGGSWYFSGSVFLRSAYRYRVIPGFRYIYIGFRCARSS
jgi:formylglycine-generating enzyme required for sulfatase activity